MKRQVKLIEGLHITAQDKRNILDCIDYLAEQPASDDPPWLGRGKSPKRYAIEEDPTHAAATGSGCAKPTAQTLESGANAQAAWWWTCEAVARTNPPR